MDEANTTFIVGFLFILRCLIPLLILLGISYLLKRIGLIPKSADTTREKNSNSGEKNEDEGVSQTNAA